MRNVTILDVRLRDGGKPLRAFVDIKYDGLIIRDLRVIKEDGKPLTVVCPQTSWRDKAGFIKYRTVITFPAELKGEIDRLVLNAYAGEMEPTNGKAT